MADVACAPKVSVKAKLCTHEGRTQLSNMFLGCVAVLAEPVLQISIKAGLMARPMRQLVEGHVVELIGPLEPSERRH